MRVRTTSPSEAPSDCRAPSILSIANTRLRGGVLPADRPVTQRGGGARDADVLAVAHRAGKAGRALPHGAASGIASGHRPRLSTRTARGIDCRWWLRSPDAVRNGGVRYSSPQSPGIGRRVSRAAWISARSASVSVNENSRSGVVDVRAFAEARTDDHARDAGLIEDVAGGDVGNRDADAGARPAASRRAHAAARPSRRPRA